MPSNPEHEIVSSGDPGHHLYANNAPPLMPDFENRQLANVPGLTGISVEHELENLFPMRPPFSAGYTIDSSYTMDEPQQQDPLPPYTLDGPFNNPGQYNVQGGWGQDLRQDP